MFARRHAFILTHQTVFFFFSFISRESERKEEGGEREKHINWLLPIHPLTRAGEPPIKVEIEPRPFGPWAYALTIE